MLQHRLRHTPMLKNKKTILFVRIILALLLFFAVLLGTEVFCTFLDRNTPAIYSGDTMPADIGTQLYSVRYESIDDDTVGFLVYGVPDCVLELAVAFTRPFELAVDGQTIFKYTGESGYSRIHTAELPAEAFSDGRGVLIELQSFELGANRDRLKIALGRPETIRNNLQQANYLYFFIFGVCCMIMITCLVLVLKKKSEASYLITLFIFAAVTILTTLFALNDQGFNVSYAASEPYHIYMTTLLDISGALACALIPLQCMEFPSQRARKLYLKWILIPCVAYSIILIVFALLGLGLTLRIFFRFFYFVGLPALCAAFVIRGRGSIAMLLAYALIRGLGSYSNALETLSPLTLFIKFSLFDTIPFMLVCMTVIYSRFGMKFRESECLNAELSEMSASLDRRVLECTAEIERDRIQLIETEKRRHTMMTNIFHDIRNPIFSIKGCLDMMEPENANDKRLLEIIKSRLGELRELTENLFLISRLEEREVIFSESAQDMSELCFALVRLFVISAQEKDIIVSTDICRRCFVSGDSFWLRRMLENLLDNALKYTPQGGNISIRLRCINKTAIIDIEDTGKGIGPEDLPHIFDRYYHGKLEDKNKSSGLGLSIAREIAVQHGGCISARSELAKGTVLTVSLPVLEISEKE